jgi:transcription elongation regulator 1
MTEEDIMWQLQQMQGSDEEEEEEQEQQQEVVKEIVKQEEPVVEKKTEMTEEERIDKFNELLLERNISPFAMYATEYPDLMTDPRFSCK